MLQVFLLATQANTRQWRKASDAHAVIANSFFVPPAKNFNVGF